MKNKIASLVVAKTIMFLAATGFIVIFKIVFGDENTLIGVSSFIAMLMFMERDLTGNLLKNTISLVLINLIVGIGIFIVSINMWIGIPINFILVFLIGYYFCNDLKKPIYLPFMLQYVFLFAFPVNFSGEGKRLLALFIGALLIMLPQILFNMKKLQKLSKKTFNNLSELLSEKVELLNKNKDTDIIDKKIDESINSLKIAILQRKDKKCNLSLEGESTLNILVCLQKLNIRISDEKYITENMKYYIKNGLENFKKSINKEISYKDFKEYMAELNSKYEKDLGKDINSVQILNSFKIIENRLNGTQKKKYTFNKEEIKKKFSIRRFIEENKEGVGFSYGVRAGIGIAITCFITQFFHLKEGEWMVFTIYSLVNPIYEVSRYKSRDRVISTFLGAIAVIILLSIFKNQMERSILLLLVGYVMTYFSEYKYMIFFSTICVVAMATGTGSVTEFAAQRFGYVIIGLCIALILNKFILKRNLENINESLKERYTKLVRDMIESIYIMAKNNKLESGKIEENFLTTSLIENKIKENYEISLVEGDKEVELRKRILAIDVFSLYVELEENLENSDYRIFFETEMKKIDKGMKKEFNIDEFTEKINKGKSIEEKIIYANIFEVGKLINEVN